MSLISDSLLRTQSLVFSGVNGACEQEIAAILAFLIATGWTYPLTPWRKRSQNTLSGVDGVWLVLAWSAMYTPPEK